MICLHTRVFAWLALSGSLAFAQNAALRVTEPVPQRDGTIMTREPAIQLKGTLSGSGGDTRILWTNQRGFSDLATVDILKDRRSIAWSTTAAIPLRPGVNHVRIRALGQPGAAAFVNIFYTANAPAAPPPQRSTMLHGQQVTYEVIDGRAVYQGDMILGTAADVAAGRFAGGLASGGLRPQAVTVAPNLTYASGLWPIVNGVVRVPYTVTAVDAANINAAIAESNTQLANRVQWVPATANDINLVSFQFDSTDQSGSCEAIVGMGGGTQPIGGSGACTTVTILHEMGHALGLYHEQSRADRNTYINYMESNVDKPQHANFDIMQAEVDSGLYNYASIMEYGPFSFSRYGLSPVIETIPAGIVLSTDLPQYTTGDVDGIERLYGFTPSAITVDSNPTGLQVVVDGTTCTAPCVFSNWTLGSQHTLNVPQDSHSQTLQTLNQQPYIFGRWNTTSESQSITVTNSAGNGTLLSPTTSPAITNYLASFIPVHPYNPVIDPAGAATIAPSPAPGTLIINGTSTNYYEDRQVITLNVQPANGYSFYDWANVPLYNFYARTYTFYITSNFDYLNFDTSDPVTAQLVTDPVLTVTAESEDIGSLGIAPGFTIGVFDPGNTSNPAITGYTPRNFDETFDEVGFRPGSSLTLCASGWTGTSCPASPVAVSPVTTNVTYLFGEWNGYTGAATNGITLAMPSSSQTMNANYVSSFRVIILPSSYCTGISVTSSPAGTNSNGTDGGLDAFYTGQTVTFTANMGATGLDFATWTQDLSSSTNPYAYSLQGELIGTANFNVPGTTVGFPLAITGISPATPIATNAAVDLIVTGSGFTTNSGVTYASFGTSSSNFPSRSATLQSSTQLTIHLQVGDIPAAGYYQILLTNVAASGCNPQTVFTFPVANSAGAPALSISKMHSWDFGPGQLNATYTILVANSGTASISQPVTVTEAVPSGESLVSMSGGSSWNCSAPTCTNSNTLAAGVSYPAITVTVNVAGNATSPQVNSATVSGGGAQSATATDSTTIVATVSTPNVTGDAEAAAESAIVNGGLVVGAVTNSASNTVPAGDVISTSPSGGIAVPPGTAVSIVVSSGSSVTLQSIRVTPVNPSIALGSAQQFTATGTYSDNSTQNLTNSVTWSSGTTMVATISAMGKASGIKIGSSTISASTTSPAVPGSTTLTVAALGPCDVNQDGFYSVADAQAMINQALGESLAANDLNGDHIVNAVDLQIVINAVLSLGCTL